MAHQRKPLTSSAYRQISSIELSQPTQSPSSSEFQYNAAEDQHIFLTDSIHMTQRYRLYFTSYYIILALFMGLILAHIDNIAYIDGIFLTASAMTGAGLSTVPMSRVSIGGFGMLGILMICGCSVTMLLPLLIYRRERLRIIRLASLSQVCVSPKPKYSYNMSLQDDTAEGNESGPDGDQQMAAKRRYHPRLTIEQKMRIVCEYELVEDATTILILLILFYLVSWIMVGYVILASFLHLQPLQPELEERGMTNWDNAVFLAVSSFSNTGLTLTSDGIIGLSNNPCAYLWLTVLIVAGNTGLPVLFRLMVTFTLSLLQRLARYFGPHSTHWRPLLRIKKALLMILNEPRRLTTHMFTAKQTKVLIGMILLLIIVQYICFLASTLERSSALSNHTTAELAGIGYFQTLSTRNAGFSMMDLRQLNQGLLFIYAIMMYISSFPFISTLERSQAGPNKPSLTILSTSNALHSKSTDEAAATPALKAAIEEAQYQEQTAVLQREATQQSTKGFLFDQQSYHEASEITSKFAQQYLLKHSFLLLLAVFTCAFSEDKILSDPTIDVNLWYIIFEIISAYGSVGLSLGIPGQVYSLSGGMTKMGKLVVIAIMILGKHRGLPSSADEVCDFDFFDYQYAKYDVLRHVQDEGRTGIKSESTAKDVNHPSYLEGNDQTEGDEDIRHRRIKEIGP